jgi:hypothetical protein
METSQDQGVIHVTVDEIGPDADGILLATLVSDAGESITCPLHLLPQESRVGDVLTLTFQSDPDERARRRKRILDLQRRLFGSR